MQVKSVLDHTILIAEELVIYGRLELHVYRVILMHFPSQRCNNYHIRQFNESIKSFSSFSQRVQRGNVNVEWIYKMRKCEK